MKKLMLVSALLGLAMTSCGLFSKIEPWKTHSMDYIAEGYCENPTLTNKSAMSLDIGMLIKYKDGENYTSEYRRVPALKPNEVLDTSGIQFKLGTRVEYAMSWNDWKQGDVIKYELRCNDTLEPLKIDIAYGDHHRERLYVKESKEAKASGLDYEWLYIY